MKCAYTALSLAIHCMFVMYSHTLSLSQAEAAVRLWVKCLALTRIVHGNTHWELARCHVQLAKAYLDLRSKYMYCFVCIQQNQLNNMPPLSISTLPM